MRRKTLNRLFVLVVGLLTASGTFKTLNHDTTALLLFVVAIVLFCVTFPMWLVRSLSAFRGNTKVVSLDLKQVPASDAVPIASTPKQEMTSNATREVRPSLANPANESADKPADHDGTNSVLPSELRTRPGSELDEEKRQILSVLFQRSSLPIHSLEAILHMQRNVALYHLEELRKEGYVTVEHSRRITRGTVYHISQKGREFAIWNDLSKPAPRSAPLVTSGRIPFPAGPPRWLEYTQDVIDDVVWRWQYNREIDDSPRNLVPHCRECLTPMAIANQNKGVRIPGTSDYQWFALIRCAYHPRVYEIALGPNGDFINIKRRILETIQDGSYDAIVARQREARGW
jgi:DNA-binding transcriptional ArsR family regulator